MKGGNRPLELGRRQFLRGGASAAAAAAAVGAMPRRAEATPALARITYPSVRLANLTELKVDQPVQI